MTTTSSSSSSSNLANLAPATAGSSSSLLSPSSMTCEGCCASLRAPWAAALVERARGSAGGLGGRVEEGASGLVRDGSTTSRPSEDGGSMLVRARCAPGGAAVSNTAMWREPGGRQPRGGQVVERQASFSRCTAFESTRRAQRGQASSAKRPPAEDEPASSLSSSPSSLDGVVDQAVAEQAAHPARPTAGIDTTSATSYPRPPLRTSASSSGPAQAAAGAADGSAGSKPAFLSLSL